MWNDKYRIRYNWEPSVVSSAIPANIYLSFYNGEREFIDFQGKEKNTTEERTVPQEFYLKCNNSSGDTKNYKIIFNEEEIFAAFKKLNTVSPNQEIKLQIEINSINNTLKTFLKKNRCCWYSIILSRFWGRPL